MDENVEVLEPVDNWEKTIAKSTVIKKIKVPVQSMIVNGQQQAIYGDSYCLACPVCNSIVWQFQVGTDAVDIVKSLCTDNEEDYNKMVFCKNCGQKLRVMRPTPIIQEDNE